jgi:hypothetical protein
MIATTMNAAISERIRSNAFERGSAVGASSGGMKKNFFLVFNLLSGPVCGRALHSQVAALPADSIRFHWVGVYLRLVDKPALGAP